MPERESFAPGVGGQADPLLGDPGTGTAAGAASAALPSTADAQQLAQQLIRQLVQARAGGTGGLVPSAAPSSPVLPAPPMKVDTAGTGTIPQGPFASVGSRKRADTQATFDNVGNLLNKVQERHYQEKVKKLQQDYETLGKATQGYKEGEATGNREMMEHNARIINSIVMDPKKAKELAKGMNVDLNPMAEKKGKGKDKPDPANDAFKAAFAKDMQAFQKGETPLAPQAQAMMRQMPQTLQTDPRFQNYLEGLKAGAYPKAGEILTFEKGVIDVGEKIQANKVTNETKMAMSENLGKAMLNRTLMQQYGQTMRTQMMQLGAQDRAVIMADALKYRADQVLKGQTDRTNTLRDKLQSTTNDQGKKLLLLMNGLDKAAKKNSKDMEDAKKQGDTARMKWLNQQADALAMQQRLVNDQAERMVGIDPQEPPDQKNMGLSDSEYSLFKEIFKDETQPSGKTEDASGDEE